MTCAGCGEPLPPGEHGQSGEGGRSAQFHDAGCRRRARLASKHDQLVAAVAAVEAAIVELQRVVQADAEADDDEQ